MNIKDFKRYKYCSFNRTILNVKADVLNKRKSAAQGMLCIFDILMQMIIQLNKLKDAQEDNKEWIIVFCDSYKKYEQLTQAIIGKDRKLLEVLIRDFDYPLEQISKIAAFDRIVRKYYNQFVSEYTNL